MKKIALLFFSLLLYMACEINHDTLLDEEQNEQLENEPCNFQGRTYTLTSYLYEIPVDLNNDQVYSNEILDQTACFVANIHFNVDDRSPDLLAQFASANVTTDTSGNLVQSSGCIFSDGARLTCFRNGEEVLLTFNNNVVYTGTISDNGNVLTFVIPNERLRQYHFGSHIILNEDNTITNYEGTMTLRFELQ